jgi:hypothetical protein
VNRLFQIGVNLDKTDGTVQPAMSAGVEFG